MNHNFKQLRAFILRHSVAQTWESARLEWDLAHVETLGAGETTQCPCGYEPIRHLCWLHNKETKGSVFVGTVCVHRFLPEHDANTIVDGLRRIELDADKAPNAALLRWAHEHGAISRWEYDFGMDTGRKRNLSFAQSDKRREVNIRIMSRLVSSRYQHGGVSEKRTIAKGEPALAATPLSAAQFIQRWNRGAR